MAYKNTFSDENIQKLFGHEAAEDEVPQRLREYYFKSSVYDQITSHSPVRLLVGHKGTGKSALFQVARAEDREANRIAISVQPNDIASLAVDTSNFLLTIRSWTQGLYEIISRKALDLFGIRRRDVLLNLPNYNDDVIAFLSETIKTVDTNEIANEDSALQFLEDPHIIVYIDDLDRGWQGKRDDVRRISALINAVRDISSQNRKIIFKIALRSDVYYLVRTSDESTDKIEGSVIWHTWTNHEIFVLLVKRIETFYGRTVDEVKLLSTSQKDLAKYLSPIIEPKFTGRGHWANAPMYRVLMSLIRKRPRDLVKLCTLAARKAYARNGSLITTADFEGIFEVYSQGRIQDTINEYQSELPNIRALLMNMRPYKKEREAKKGYVYTTADLFAKLDSIIQSHHFDFADGKAADKKNLAAFLYKINFLTARKDTSDGIIRKYFEESQYLASGFVDFGFAWEVHPAYRWALQPDSINDIFDSTELTIEET